MFTGSLEAAMSDRLKTPLAAFAGAALALLLGHAWPQATAAPPPEAAWDYRVLRLDPRDYSDKLDWKEAVRMGGNQNAAEPIFYEHVLDTLARDGWELVQSEQRTPTVTYFYLRKRNR